jgi:hypothetical protein
MRLEGTRANPEAPRYDFGTLDDMLNNAPLEVVSKFGTGDWNGLQTSFGFFVQDDWRIASNLTINLGLRYDFYSNFVATGQGATPDAGLYNTDGMSLDGLFTVGPLLPRDKPYGNDGNNFAPRFGFAYSPGGSNKTSIRGGFGIMYSTMIPEVFWNQPSQGVNLPNRFDFDQTDIARFAIDYPQYNDQFFDNVLQATAEDPDAIFVSTLYDPTLKSPYTMQYSLDIQRQITSNLLFQTGFVGMRGLHFPMYRDANQPARLTGLRPNSRLSQPDYVDNAQQTTYFGWQNSLRKRFSNRLSFDVNYTWSKALSNGGGDIGASYGGENSGSRNQEFFDMRADYGPTQADLAHYFAAGWVYEAPGANLDNAAARNVLGGWTLSGIFRGSTGQPERITDSGRSGQRADYLGGEAVLSNYHDTLQYLNKDAFAEISHSPAGIPDHPGSAGNGIIRSPGLVNLDLSIAKNIQIGETVRLQLRTDLINAFNHTNLTNLSTGVNSGSFGRLRNTAGARIAQINLRLTF